MASTTETISADAARRIVLHLQGLAESPRQRLTGAALLELIERLGFVQVDSINMVERAHQMILHSRRHSFRPRHLQRLLERERHLFEHWTHDASIIPARFYPYWRHRFEREAERLWPRFHKRHGGDFQATLDEVLAHVRENGPVLARDLSDDEDRPRTGWWDWHGGKTALEYLWRTGQLAVARRQGFQKVYDLSERVVHPELIDSRPEHQEFVDWACGEALQRLCFGTPGELAGFWNLVTTEEAKAWCEANLGGRVVVAEVGGVDGAAPRRLFASADWRAMLEAARTPPGRMRVLNPFDPVLRDRQRLERLFGFDYRIEVFVPAEKRRYGYYVFPLLERDRLVGRIDMKADRGQGVLKVDALWLEPRYAPTPARMDRLEAALGEVRDFAGMERVTFADGYLKS